MWRDGYNYLGTWTYPTEVDGTGEAVLTYTAPTGAAAPIEDYWYLTFHSDQGDFGPFLLNLTK